MKGINEHVIRNSPCVNIKVMKRWKITAIDDRRKTEMSRDSENVRSHPIKSVTTSACAIREPDAIDVAFERSLLHWYFPRLISSLIHSSCFPSFSCLLLSGFDSDLLIRGLRSVQLLTLIEALSLGLRPVQLTPLKVIMAGSDDLRTLGQFAAGRITIAKQVLKDSAEGRINARPPQQFKDTRNSNFQNILTEDVANEWIRFGMPPVIVYSAYFAKTRSTSEATAEALELAYKILQRSQESEKECSGWDFLSKGSRFVKVFTSRCPYEHDTVGLLMDKEIHSRLDELWIVLTKGHFPEPLDDQKTAAASEAKIKYMKQRYRGTPSFSTDPSATSWLAITRTPDYFKVMDELAKVNPKSPSDNHN